jgi:hypothetical protein
MMATVNWPAVRSSTFQFENSLPATTPANRILLNQELISAFILTRTMKSGVIITMGYCELNQRDSFWSSWVHLVLFREAERVMISESCDGQLPSGKIPTTLLPLINREWDIDITAYFVLRIARYLHYHRDVQTVQGWMPNARKAVGYLVSLLDENNVPWARDFWADWKDVEGMNNRLYGPCFVLLVKAAIKEFNWMAAQLGEEPVAIEINCEPLWSGVYYQDVMRDGSVDRRFHQDQMLGGFWNVCGEGRYELMLAQAEHLETEFGLPETLPFYQASFGYDPGDYHNGGIWPWLAFADAAARIASGHASSGENLAVKVATTDIVAFGDLAPNEYCQGITGEQRGNSPQGWNAAAFLVFSLMSEDPRNDLPRYMQEIR